MPSDSFEAISGQPQKCSGGLSRATGHCIKSVTIKAILSMGLSTILVSAWDHTILREAVGAAEVSVLELAQVHIFISYMWVLVYNRRQTLFHDADSFFLFVSVCRQGGPVLIQIKVYSTFQKAGAAQ